MENLRDKICYLKDIYDRQHYFVDRHDSMAEKFINILLVETTLLTLIITVLTNNSDICKLKYIAIVVYIVMFTITLIKLFLVVRPLSGIAKDNEGSRFWISNSIIYYQGINSHKLRALEKEESPTKAYLEIINDENICADLTRQILILAQYSEYKNKKLKKSVKWVIGTLLMGVVDAALLVLL